MASRWYRPPEIVLTERHYNQKADVWSVGCIFGECINFSDDMNGIGRAPEKRVLFQGSSCYPISPCLELQNGAGPTKISENDQFIKILEVLGQRSDEDLSYLTDQNSFIYTNQVQGQLKGQGLAQRFKPAAAEAVELLEAMLEFNPYFRASAIELIRHKWFDDIRNKKVENGAPFQIHLKCDQMDAYDYTHFQDGFCKAR